MKLKPNDKAWLRRKGKPADAVVVKGVSGCIAKVESLGKTFFVKTKQLEKLNED